MSTVSPAAIAELRRYQEQSRASLGIVARATATDELAAALEKARARERRSKVDGAWVFSDGARYPAHTERLRWARTRDIISRAAPGADEDANYLEMMARQAASVEMIIRGEHLGEPLARGTEVCDRVLLGTIPAIRPDAFSRRFDDWYFVLLSAGLIQFVYQLTKASVLSWLPSQPDGGAGVAFKNRPEDVEAVLAKDPGPLLLLGKTLDAYIFEGRPRVEFNKAPARNYQMPLQFLTNLNERFIIAHEYGHTLHDAADIVGTEPGWNEEFAADVMAFTFVLRSGEELDLLPPCVSTQGAYFVLTALDIIRKTLDIVRHGTVQPDRGFDRHPPIAHRLEVLKEAYAKSVPPEDENNPLHQALGPAHTLELLWNRLQEQGVDRWRTGRAPHPIWDATGAPSN